MHHHHIQSPLSSKVYVNLILIKKWGQHPREYEYLKVKLRMQKWIIDKTTFLDKWHSKSFLVALISRILGIYKNIKICKIYNFINFVNYQFQNIYFKK